MLRSDHAATIHSREGSSSLSTLRTGQAAPRTFSFIDCKPRLTDFRQAVIAGLSSQPKVLEPKFFYDEEGSLLFEAICSQPEYYPTATEMQILEAHADAMRQLMGEGAQLIEFGSGSSRKIRLLLDRLAPRSYVAIDISREQLLAACEELATLYPQLAVTAVCADYSQPIGWQPEQAAGGASVVFFPGSTIGNFMPHEAIHFLMRVRMLIGTDGGLLVGVDTKKDRKRLDAAYNDRAGVTAAFNLNLLHRINRELGADFRLEQFGHHAFYNERLGRIEMHLRSRCRQQVKLGEHVFLFEEGESIHTENSYKYTDAEFHALAAQAGFDAVQVWHDADELFGVHYLRAR